MSREIYDHGFPTRIGIPYPDGHCSNESICTSDQIVIENFGAIHCNPVPSGHADYNFLEADDILRFSFFSPEHEKGNWPTNIPLKVKRQT